MRPGVDLLVHHWAGELHASRRNEALTPADRRLVEVRIYAALYSCARDAAEVGELLVMLDAAVARRRNRRHRPVNDQ